MCFSITWGPLGGTISLVSTKTTYRIAGYPVTWFFENEECKKRQWKP